MATSKAPKQWTLSKDESLNSYNNWKENLIYTLSLDSNFSPFLKDDAKWNKASSTDPNRGLTDDDGTVEASVRKTKEQKVIQLNMMLGQIANFATVISRNQIVKNSTSLGDIWAKIREHYGFHITGSRFLDLANIRLEMNERSEDLYQRLLTFFDDNLLTTDSALTHHSVQITANEEVTPSLENVIVLLWLERIHIGLPGMIKQRYGAELRNKTLASIKPEISQALPSLLDELKGSEESRIMRTQTQYGHSNNRGNSSSFRKPNNKVCCLCLAAKRSGADTHFLSQCRFLPEPDRRRMNASSKIRNIETVDTEDLDDYQDELDTEDNNNFIDNPSPAVQRRVTTRKSPYINCFYMEIPCRVCLDSGAESNMMSHRFALYIGISIRPSRQGAVQADEKTPLDIIGEVKGIILKRGAHNFTFDGLVTRNDIGDIIGGEPFLEDNDIALRPARKQIIIRGKEIIPYSTNLL